MKPSDPRINSALLLAAEQIASTAAIRKGETYTKDEFLRRSGLTESSFRAARRAGLVVRYVHGRAWVLGDDWFRYLEEQGKPTKDGQAPRSQGADNG